jgi:hypothetical protein
MGSGGCFWDEASDVEPGSGEQFQQLQARCGCEDRKFGLGFDFEFEFVACILTACCYVRIRRP